MDSGRNSGTVSTGASSGSSSPYADIESASNLHLMPYSSSNSESLIFQGRKSSGRTATVLSVIALVASTLCLLSVAGLVSFWYFFVNDDAFSLGQEAQVCLPCLQVSPNPLDSSPSDLWARLDVHYDADNDTQICCAGDSRQYAALFKLILQRQEEVKKLADSLDSAADVSDTPLNIRHVTDGAGASPTTSAHVLFKPRPQSTTDNKEYQHWKSPKESPMSHVAGGLKFLNNRFIVQSPGLYYVYCQVMYTPSTDDNAGLASTYVKRYSVLRPSAPNLLLKARHTRHNPDNDRHSSYVGGVFQLHKGDTLFVQVSKPDLISHDDVASFFGLFRVGQ